MSGYSRNDHRDARNFRTGHSETFGRSFRTVRVIRTETSGRFGRGYAENSGTSGSSGPTFPKLSEYPEINRVALSVLPELLSRWLPGGRMQGHEYVVRNPLRADSHPGSFCINLRSGKWADFATGECGGDPISLVAYLQRCKQSQAAKDLAEYLGVTYGEC